MKTIVLLSFVCFSLVSTGCKKNKDHRHCLVNDTYYGTVQVVKDCTGTYIRYLGKDYRVCNEELLKHFTDGSSITASFGKSISCPDMPMYLCNMYHENEGLVTISCLH